MARRSDGYRARRLAVRRTRRRSTYQNVALYVLAAAVAFGAVVGATRLAHKLLSHHVTAASSSYLALVVIGKGEAGQPVAALLAHGVAPASDTLYTIPRDLLLTSPGGEYVLASDALAQDWLQSYLERLVQGAVSYRLDLSYADLERLSGGGDLWVTTAAPFSLQIDGVLHTYRGRFSLPARLLPTVLGADGKAGPDQAAAEQAFLSAALKGAALASQASRSAALAAISGHQNGLPASDTRDVVRVLTSSRLTVTRIPSTGETAQGQFAWRPDGAAITAQITRDAKGFNAPYTVVVENGSGALGIGALVAKLLAVLNVNLPPTRNADSFDYQETQILAGSKAFGVATQVRAILRRGVVLKGTGLPPTTVVVIVGKDLRPKDLQ